MSLAFRSAAPLKPEIRLSQACEDFRKSLNKSQRNDFQELLKRPTPTSQDVTAFAMEIDREISWKSKRCLGPRLGGFLGNIQNFVTIGDVLVGGSQNMPAIAVWSAVRLTIQVLCNVSNFLERLSEVLMEVFAVYSVQQTLVRMYPSYKTIQYASCEYLVVVVKMFTKAVGHLNNPRKLGNILAVSMKGFEGEFGPMAKELKDCARLLKQEVDLASKAIQLEIKQDTNKLLQAQSLQERHRREQARSHLLNSLSSYDARSAWRYAREKGAPTWIFQQPDYCNWKTSPSSCIIWLTGIIGSGKSVVAANVVQDLQMSSSTAKVGYFFIRPDESKSTEYRTILGSLAKQLFHTAHYPSDDSINAIEASEIDIEYIEKAIPDLPSQQIPYHLVIDGLDECTPETCRKVICFLHDLTKKAVGTFLVLLTGRQDLPYRVHNLVEAEYTISMDKGSDELQSYIIGEMMRRREQEDFPVDISHVETISEALVAGSHGMFLWAAFQIDALSEAVTEAEVLELLVSLPEDLPQTYDRVLRKLHRSKKADLRKKLFTFISAAKRPFTLDELAEALSVVPGTRELDQAQMILDIRKALLYGGGSLLDIDEEKLTVHFAHPSIHQHLSSSLSSDLQQYLVEEVAADLCLGNVCMTYLCFNKFEAQLVRRVQQEEDHEHSETAVTIPRMTGSEISTSMLGKTVMWLRGGRQEQRAFNIAAQLASFKPPRLQLESFVDDDTFLPYAQDFWLHHTRCIEVSDRPQFSMEHNDKRDPDRLWFHLLTRVVPVAQMPWGPFDFDSMRTECIEWVINNSHHALFRQQLQHILKEVIVDSSLLISILYEQRASPLIHPDVFGMILVTAAHACNEHMMKYLVINLHIPVDTTSDGCFKTALQAASYSCNIPMMKFLISHGANVNAPAGKWGSAIAIAALGSRSPDSKAAVQLLMSHGADVHANAGELGSALRASVDSGNKPVEDLLLKQYHGTELDEPLVVASSLAELDSIQKLVKQGANVNVEVAWGPRTPLRAACEAGHEDAVKLLLSYGALVEMVSGAYGEYNSGTALMDASSDGHFNVVKLLLENGASPNQDVKFSSGTALYCAAENGKFEVCSLLLAKGADPNRHPGRYGSALNVAIDRQHTAIVKLLLDHGADPFIEGYLGDGYWQAQISGIPEIADLLKPYANGHNYDLYEPPVYREAVSRGKFLAG